MHACAGIYQVANGQETLYVEVTRNSFGIIGSDI